MSAKLWTEEQFNCPVCLDLPSDPVTIPCGHSYCMACIADFWTTEKTPGVYSCPECRQTFSPKPQLCRNTMLAEAMEQLRKGTLSSSARDTIRRAHGDSVRANAKAGRASSANGPRRSKAQLSAAAVPCDQCLDGGCEAVKTCLVCMASFCETHLKPHQTNAKLKGHELIAPTGQLTEKICTQHKYLQEFYCRPCQMYICWLCTSNAHKGHDSVSTQTQRTEKQKEVEVAQTQNQQRLQEREKELKDMKKVLETLTRSSEKVQEEVETVLGELQQSVQRLQDLLGEVMLSTGQEKLSETQDVVQKLEAEISQLKKRETDTRDLIRSQDNIYFLQNFQALVSPVEVADLGSVSVTPDVSFDAVRATILELRERVEEMCNQELNKINRTDDQKMGAFLKPNSTPQPQTQSRQSRQRTEDREMVGYLESDTWSISSLRPRERQRREEREPADNWSLSSLRPRDRQRRESEQSERGERWSLSSLLPRNRRKREERGTVREIDLDSIQAPEPRTRDEFLQYACALILDPNSAHRRLVLSDGNTVATVQASVQVCADSPQRFDGWTQVVCVGPLAGERCYWEVEWRGRGSSLGVALASMPRKGPDSRSGLGYNAQSWSLELSDMCCAALHNNQKQDIPVTYSPRVGLFLDRAAQTLAFYAVDDELSLLHTFRSSALSQPLYAAFGVGCGLGVGLDFASGQFSAQTDSIKICPI
ncbi:hypothetical protein ACEWY4_016676 [Coilia grayii]|uniref:E3 ubiquitin/ISG15 ligase TRIM25-like n=1 Tax=Coilia grayii TaxID=363190 RepID=A0ABD1JL20_9TELE